jgi:protein-tyrosine-phosphatase
MSATKNAQLALQDKGIDLTMHASQAVTEKLLEKFNLVLCMENAHVNFICKNFPAFKDRIFLFSEITEEKYEIEDPVGRSLEDYRITANHLLSIFQTGFEKIRSLSC